VAQALPVLRAPRNKNFFGSYAMFLKYDLPRHLAEPDLPVVLGRLIRWTHCFDSLSAFEELAEAAFVEALQQLGTKSIRRLAARVWLAKKLGVTTRCLTARTQRPSGCFERREDLRRALYGGHPQRPGHRDGR
jgi:hypothetical protein